MLSVCTMYIEHVHFESARSTACEHITITYKNQRWKRTAWPKTSSAKNTDEKQNWWCSDIDLRFTNREETALFLHTMWIVQVYIFINGIHSQAKASKNARFIFAHFTIHIFRHIYKPVMPRYNWWLLTSGVKAMFFSCVIF